MVEYIQEILDRVSSFFYFVLFTLVLQSDNRLLSPNFVFDCLISAIKIQRLERRHLLSVLEK